MSTKRSTHHDWCGECIRIGLFHTPKEFPQPGEIAEEICRLPLPPHKLHKAISEALAARDKLWHDQIKDREE